MKVTLKGTWEIGDRVKFNPTAIKYPKTCLGVIIKTNPKRAKVQVYVGDIKGIWCVPYRHLMKITTKHELMLLTIGKMEE